MLDVAYSNSKLSKKCSLRNLICTQNHSITNLEEQRYWILATGHWLDINLAIQV